MRDREYLVAIFAENGILCAETLRFHDEIKGPEDIGLPKAVTVPRQRVWHLSGHQRPFQRDVGPRRAGRPRHTQADGGHRQEDAQAKI